MEVFLLVSKQEILL